MVQSLIKTQGGNKQLVRTLASGGDGKSDTEILVPNVNVVGLPKTLNLLTDISVDSDISANAVTYPGGMGAICVWANDWSAATTVGILVSPDSGTTWLPLRKEDETEVAFTVDGFYVFTLPQGFDIYAKIENADGSTNAVSVLIK